MTRLPRMQTLAIATVLGIGGALSGCVGTPAPTSQVQANDMHTQAMQALADFRAKNPGIDARLNDAYGYAIFPSVGAGAVGVGGASGKGEVYERGRLIGYARLNKVNVGLQLGGEEYSELVLFQNAAALADFRDGKTTFDAKASAVAANAGSAANADYVKGVMVFANPKTGLMAQAAVGGQTFKFQPLSTVRPETASERP